MRLPSFEQTRKVIDFYQIFHTIYSIPNWPINWIFRKCFLENAYYDSFKHFLFCSHEYLSSWFWEKDIATDRITRQIVLLLFKKGYFLGDINIHLLRPIDWILNKFLFVFSTIVLLILRPFILLFLRKEVEKRACSMFKSVIRTILYQTRKTIFCFSIDSICYLGLHVALFWGFLQGYRFLQAKSYLIIPWGFLLFSSTLCISYYAWQMVQNFSERTEKDKKRIRICNEITRLTNEQYAQIKERIKMIALKMHLSISDQFIDSVTSLVINTAVDFSLKNGKN